MDKTVLLLGILVLLTAVQGLSLDDGLVDSSLNEASETTKETVNDLQDSTTGEREKYILMIERSNYRPQVLQDLGIEIRYQYSIIDGVAVEMPSGLADVLDEIEFVESVEPDPITSLPVLETEESENEPESYSGGENRVIAVLDTGIDNNHLDLENEVVGNQDFTGSGPEDRHGHGTHVASIAAGTGAGNSRYAGVAPEASLLNVKVLGDDGSGRASDAIKGIDHSVENNVDVIVMSLGVKTECDGTDPLSQAADNAVEEGFPVIVAAGNEGPNSGTITSPGCGHQVLAIGASGNNQVSSFSSRGPTADGRIKPDIVAPGVDVYAAEAGTSSSYISKSGTSMSAPYAAGATVLLMDEWENDPSGYFEALTDTAYSLNAGENSEGSGRINITSALNYHQRQSRTDNDDPGSDSAEDNQNNEDGSAKNGQEEKDSSNNDQGLTEGAVPVETELDKIKNFVSMVEELIRGLASSIGLI